MPDVYTDDWYQAVVTAINDRVADLPGLPEENLHVAVDIEGDGLSPYVEPGGARHFLIRIAHGHCDWYREIPDAAQSTDDLRLDFRFVGPAATFDAVIAGQLEPIDAALSGAIHVKGDMRFLMRQAEHVQVLLEAYTNGVETDWPKGAPPHA
jgi:putative sterol carrier protein